MWSQGMQVSDRGVQLVSNGVVEPRDTREMAARNLKMVQRSRWSPESNQKSIVAHLISAKKSRVDFPSCEKVVKMIVKDLDTLGYHRLVFLCDNEPSILSLVRAVKLAWTIDVVPRNVR